MERTPLAETMTSPRRPAGARQLKREDPNAPLPLALKPGMCVAVAVHPSHPCADGWAYNAQTEFGEAEGDPVLIRVPARHVWDEDATPPSILPGTEVDLRKVSCLVPDGVLRIRSAWEKGEVIRAIAIPQAQAQAFIEANLERTQNQAAPPIARDILEAVEAFKAANRLEKPMLRLGNALASLPPRDGTPIRVLAERMGITEWNYFKAMAMHRFWAQLGRTPEEMNCRERLPVLVRQLLAKGLNEKLQSDSELGHQVATRALPHFTKALVHQAEELRAVHGEVPLFAEPEEAARVLAELIVTNGPKVLLASVRPGMDDEAIASVSLADLPGEALANWSMAAVEAAYWKNLSPGWRAGLASGRVALPMAFAFVGCPGELQERGLLDLLRRLRLGKRIGDPIDFRNYHRKNYNKDLRDSRAESAPSGKDPGDIDQE